MAWLKATRAPLTERPSRTSRWLMLVGALSVAAIGIGLLVLMTQATGNRERYNQNYEWLVLINAVVASGLLITILWGMVRLLRSLYKGQFGSRLLVKLAGIFALVGVIPGLLIYVVSYQFVSRSIESWFDVKVEAALVAGLNLGRATLGHAQRRPEQARPCRRRQLGRSQRAEPSPRSRKNPHPIGRQRCGHLEPRGANGGQRWPFALSTQG